MPFTGDEYVVILTRNHEYDAQVLEESVRRPLKCIGMTASLRKVKFILDHLRDLGFEDEAINRIHAPVSIPINAETPQEIAIFIAAELVAVRNGRDPGMKQGKNAQPRHQNHSRNTTT